jgi:hypothetical protein
MTVEQAKAIVGNQPTYALRNMVRAINMFPWINTDADLERQEAAKVVIRSRGFGT